MYMLPIYTGMKGIWLLEGMKIFPILNTAWIYVIVHKCKPPNLFFYKLFIQTQLHCDKSHKFWFNPIIRSWVMSGCTYRQDQKQHDPRILLVGLE